jgi:hypothetical protein
MWETSGASHQAYAPALVYISTMLIVDLEMLIRKIEQYL